MAAGTDALSAVIARKPKRRQYEDAREWDGQRLDGSFQSPGMNSFKHYAYGAVGDRMYQTVAGLDTDPERPSYRHLRIQPRPGA